MRTLSFEDAMAGTVNARLKTLSHDLKQNFSGYIPEVFFCILSVMDLVRAYKFQVHAAALLLAGLLAVYPLTVGLPFLEKAPKLFKCEQLSSTKMSNEIMNHKISWKPCTQDEICAEQLDSSKYKAVETDPEFFVNWIQKMDILCSPQAEIGFIGSSFFLGVIFCISFVPNMADKYGRLPVLYLSFGLQLFALFALVLTNNLRIAIFFVFILGFSHPGKNIVALNYALEQMPAQIRGQVVSLFLVIETGWIIVIALFYQYVDRSWKTLQFIGLAVTAFTLAFVSLYFHESPKHYHTVKKYAECRQAMKKIAEYNGIHDFDVNFVFADECPAAPLQTPGNHSNRPSHSRYQENELAEISPSKHMEESSFAPGSEQEDASEQGHLQLLQDEQEERLVKREAWQQLEAPEQTETQIWTPTGVEAGATPSGGLMTERQFLLNIVKMTVMWSAVSFSTHMLTFMNKFLEGSIFTNYYAEGVAGALASALGAKLYQRLGMRNMYLFSFSLALVGGIMIYLLESERLQLPPWYLASFVEGSITKTPKLRRIAVTKAVDYLVPQLTFLSKFGLQLAFLGTYTASFSNDKIFPPERRTSAIGQCQLIGRSLTVLASEATELPKPLPIVCFCVLTALAIIVSTTFDSKDDVETQQEESRWQTKTK